MRRSLLPGMRYPCRAPESNHLLTVRGATLQILATSPVVRTSFTLVVLVVLLIAFSPGASPVPRRWAVAAPRRSAAAIGSPPADFKPHRGRPARQRHAAGCTCTAGVMP